MFSITTMHDITVPFRNYALTKVLHDVSYIGATLKVKFITFSCSVLFVRSLVWLCSSSFPPHSPPQTHLPAHSSQLMNWDRTVYSSCSSRQGIIPVLMDLHLHKQGQSSFTVTLSCLIYGPY